MNRSELPRQVDESLDKVIDFRKDPDDAAASSGHLTEAIATPPTQMNVEGGVGDKVKAKRSRRSGTYYSSSSEEESDSEKPIKSRSSKHSQQNDDSPRSRRKSQYQKDVARWCPEEACRPAIEEAPVFYPNEEVV